MCFISRLQYCCVYVFRISGNKSVHLDCINRCRQSLNFLCRDSYSHLCNNTSMWCLFKLFRSVTTFHVCVCFCPKPATHGFGYKKTVTHRWADSTIRLCVCWCASASVRGCLELEWSSCNWQRCEISFCTASLSFSPPPLSLSSTFLLLFKKRIYKMLWQICWDPCYLFLNHCLFRWL